MAKMIPDYIDQEDPRRNGERLVFDWFSDKNIPGTVYYSLHQKNHRYKLISEIDFLYVCDRGFLCIEVKGGQQIYRQDMTWHSVNRLGVDNVIHNPFEQAMGCQYALKEYFSDTYGRFSEQANYLIGYAVIFPECIFTGDTNDLVDEVAFDARYNLNDFPSFLSKAFDYWENQEITKHRFTPQKLTQGQLRQANDLLRGDFQVVPSMHLEMQYAEQKMIKLTEEQYDVLDDIEENERAIIHGAAGTGKSLLAIELVRKSAAKNKNVLYLAFNRNMAAYAGNSLSDRPNITVDTYHSFVLRYLCNPALYNLNVETLSDKIVKELEKGSVTIPEFDCIVVDEGQDLFCVEFFDFINRIIKGGLEEGNWAVFMDSNQNIFNKSEEYEFTLEYIKSSYRPSIQKLKTNCRNTEQIARRTSALTLTPPAKYLKVSGPKVTTRTYSDDRSFLKSFKKEILSLLASGISPRDIVILSYNKKENSSLKDISEICSLPIIENHNIENFDRRGLNFYTVQSFKGLESKVVFYIDIPGFESTDNRMVNYVGMSRAMISLYIFYNESIKDEYESILDRGEELLV